LPASAAASVATSVAASVAAAAATLTAAASSASASAAASAAPAAAATFATAAAATQGLLLLLGWCGVVAGMILFSGYHAHIYLILRPLATMLVLPAMLAATFFW
jgi:hypothetical protein